TGWKPSVEVIAAPETVFAQFKATGSDIASMHFVNYKFLNPVKGVRLRLPVGRKPVFAAPLDDPPTAGSPREVSPGVWELPPFVRYAHCTID
ncbi:MAG: hypothetical protein PHN85_04990, partial [Kiritimatiellae bacterium]|nr:hypothetical protein [Kiritimatiellia bacterium]